MNEWTFHTIAAVDGLRLERHVLVEDDLARAAEGGALWWLVRPPALREWEEGVAQLTERAVGWRLMEEAGDVVLRVEERGAEAEVLELRGAAAEAFLGASGDDPLTAIGPYRPLALPRDVQAHISVHGPLLPPFGPGTRRISGQFALSLYRIARWHGGAFWDAAARWLARWAVHRTEWLDREKHLRFLTDLALLLLAAGEQAAADRALDEIEALAIPLAGGAWYRHDRDEVAAGRNHLVINTHLQALVALRAAGRSVAPGQRALDHALAQRAPRMKGAVLAAQIGAVDLAIAAGLGRMAPEPWTFHERWGKLRAEHPHLELVPGLLARDWRPAVAPRYYRTINLADLADVVQVAPTPAAHRALRAGLRLARATGFFAVQRRAGEYAPLLVPSLLRKTGHARAATRAAARLRAAGWAPAIGWPGCVDALWPALPPGVP